MPKLILARLIGATHPTLYTSSLFGLNCAHSVSRTDRSLENSSILADNRLGNSQSGFLLFRNKSRLNNGGACGGASMRAVTSMTDFLALQASAARLENGQGAFQSKILEANHA